MLHGRVIRLPIIIQHIPILAFRLYRQARIASDDGIGYLIPIQTYGYSAFFMLTFPHGEGPIRVGLQEG